MTSYESKRDVHVILATISRTKSNIEELEEILKKVEQKSKGSEINVGLAMLARTKRTIEETEENIKEASQIYSFLEMEKAEDDTFVNDEVMEHLKGRLAMLAKSVDRTNEFSEQMLRKGTDMNIVEELKTGVEELEKQVGLQRNVTT